MSTRFAGFELDEVQYFLKSLDKQIVEPQKDFRAGCERAGSPFRLCGASMLDREVDVGFACCGNGSSGFTGKRSCDGDLIVRTLTYCDLRKKCKKTLNR